MEQLFHDPQTSAALANFCLLTSIGLCPPTPELAQGLADGSFFSDYLECTQLIAPNDLRYAALAYYGKAADAVYQELNREYRALSRRLGVRFVDAGMWNIPLAFDGVHFTQEGHSVFAERLAEIINKGE